jgi:GDPmannose 4,6-dehydratase
MLNNPEPKEFVLSSQETHTVKEFITKAFKIININGEWQNNTDNPRNEKFYTTIRDTKTILVQIDEKFYRPAEIELLLGDSSLARKELKWKPKITFDKLIEKMVKNDCKNY